MIERVSAAEASAYTRMPATETEQFGEGIMSALRQIFDQHAGTNKKWTRHQADTFLEQYQADPDPLADLTDDGKTHLIGDEVDFESFVRYVRSPEADVLKPPPVDDLDMEWPLNNYFINSSHDTCLSGAPSSSQAESEDAGSNGGGVSPDSYRDALLRGCRSIDISVCDGDWEPSEEKSDAQAEEMLRGLTGMQRLWFRALEKAIDAMEARATDERHVRDIQGLREAWRTVYRYEPRVRDGATGATVAGFRFGDVCRTVAAHAFAAGADLPLLVTLDAAACAPAQQLAVVRIVNEAWGAFLVPAPASEPAALPTPAALRRRILVRVKPPPPSGGEAGEAGDSVVRASNFGSLFGRRSGKKEEEQGPVIIEPLAQLGVYTREAPFASLAQAEAASPTHVFTLPDAALAETHASEPAALFRHNRGFLMQTTPSLPATNPSPLGHWQKGVQMAALRRDPCDEGFMLNEAQFAGTAGFVRKPDGYRGPQMPAARRPPEAADSDVYDPDALRLAPRPRVLSRLAVHVLATQDLPPPFAGADDDDDAGVRPYVTLELHAAPHPYYQSQQQHTTATTTMTWTRARSRTLQGLAPDFGGETLDVLNVDGVVPGLAFAALRFWHEERPRDLPMAWACVRLDRLRGGYRVLRLHDMQGRPGRGGRVLVRIEMRLW